MARFRPAGKRALRLGLIVAAALIVWFVLDTYVWNVLGAAVAFVLLAVGSSVVSETTPRLVEIATGDEPLRTVVGDDSAVYNDGWALAMPHDPLEADQPDPGTPNLEARRQFVEQGGFDVDQTSLRLAIEGRSSDTVTITGLRAVIGQVTRPVAHTLIRSPSAGEGRALELEINLDDAEPVARDDGEDYFKAGYVTLVKGEVQVFRLVARTEERACEWRLEVQYQLRGSNEALLVDHGGQPFRTTARARSFVRIYDWAWYEGPKARLIRET